jgi:hypothetical protein
MFNEDFYLPLYLPLWLERNLRAEGGVYNVHERKKVKRVVWEEYAAMEGIYDEFEGKVNAYEGGKDENGAYEDHMIEPLFLCILFNLPPSF